MDLSRLVFCGAQLRWGAARGVATAPYAAQPEQIGSKNQGSTLLQGSKTVANLVKLQDGAPEGEVGGKIDELASAESAPRPDGEGNAYGCS